MKKSLRNIILLSSLLLVLVLVFYFSSQRNDKSKLESENSKETEQIENKSKKLLDLTKEEIDKIELHNSNGNFVFVVDDNIDKNNSAEIEKESSLESIESTSVSEVSSQSEATAELNDNIDKPTNSESQDTQETKGIIKNKEFSLNEPKLEHISKVKINSIVDSLVNLKIVENLGSKDNLNDYGLDKKSKFIELLVNSGNRYKVIIGDKVPSISGQYYAMLEGDSVVYTVNLVDTALEFTNFDLLDPSIFDFDVKAVKNFTFYRKLDDVNMTFVSVSDNERGDNASEEETNESKPTQDNTQYTLWNVISPIDHEADSDKINELLNDISLMYAEAFEIYEPTDKELKDYQVDDNADFIFTFSNGDSKESLYIGKSSGDGKRYAYSTSRNTIFKLSESKFSKFGLDKLDLINKFALLQNITDVKTIDFKLDKEEAHFEISIPENKDNKLSNNEVEEQSTFTLNGKNVNAKDENSKNYFKTFYRSLISIMVSDFDDENEPNLNSESALKITYELKDGNTSVLELFRRDEKSYFIVLDGKYTNMYADSSVINNDNEAEPGILKSYNKMLEFLKVSTANDLK